MAATIQHKPVLLPPQSAAEDEDIALAALITNSLRFDQSQDWQQLRQQPRSRLPSQPPKKSTSTPIRNTSRPPRPTPSESSSSRRHSVMTMQDRRPSFTGSTVSEMSVNTKLSLSKKLRKVFSMNNLRSSNSDLASLAEKNGSVTSVASSVIPTPTTEKNPMSFRRRSIASLSNLFQKGNSNASVAAAEITPPQPTTKKTTNRRHSSGDLRQLAKQDKKKPALRVDTSESTSHNPKKGGLKVRSSTVSPDSPNSSRSSFSRLPPPRHFIQEPGLPSPTPSNHDDELIKPSLGLHYGIGLHGSPRLKPAASSTSSLVATERRIQFCSTIQIHETFSAGDYDRRCDNNATCQKLTPMMAMKIKQELNEYKLSDMEVHVESRQYTHFFL